MTNRIPAAILLPALVALGGCAAETDREQRVRAPAADVVGEPINCIQTRNIRSSTVHDDFTIDFEMLGGQVLRNTLPNRCPSLGFERRFAHSSTTGNLCNVDTVTVLDSNGRSGASCGLGQFVPIRYTPAGS
jgi:hypothetical protein